MAGFFNINFGVALSFPTHNFCLTMRIVNKNSLAITLDNLNQIFFDNKKLPAGESKSVARWIAKRQGLPGSYWNMFAPTSQDLKGIKLFTGEIVKSNAGISHFLGEDACHALYKLKVKDTFYAIVKAKKGLDAAIQNTKNKGHRYYGFYCCGKCSVAYWRNLIAEGVDKNKNLLRAGINILKSYRDGTGKWRRFPLYYTLYALCEINLSEATEELKYSALLCERLFRTMRKEGKYEQRRFKLVSKVLESI